MDYHDEWPDIDVEESRRILVVDGAADARLKLSLSLRREGFLVSSAKSGPEALRLMENEGLPDLIIIEILMPRMDGFSFAYEIRKVSNVPIVVVSSIGDVSTKVQAILEFAEDYMTKPVHIDELTARIWRILSHYKPRTAGEPTPRMRSAAGCPLRRSHPRSQPTAVSAVHRHVERRRPCRLGLAAN